MSLKLYNFLVNKHAGIRSRYHHIHDGSHGMRKILSWLYLLWLNFCYYILFCRFLDKPAAVKIYEEKNISAVMSESRQALEGRLSVDEYAEQLSKYDVVSFDIFDTLIFRPFTEPTDLFYFLGEKLGLLDFKRIRMEMEAGARYECFRKNEHFEVTFSDIWKLMEKETGVAAEEGMALELALEKKFCYANPFMQQVFCKLRDMGKKIIVVSDMYLPGSFLLELLEQNGYSGISKLYVSCEYGESKGGGKLFDIVKEDFPKETRIVHVGDNEHSDVRRAKEHGFSSIHYPNVNQMALSYRPYDMSPVIGGAYRGIVDNHLYAGMHSYSLEYEYGFVYGGLFVVGYCHFVHEYSRKHGMDKILFLSRDGDILKQVYDKLYPNDNTSYVYWSRAAATKLMAGYNRYDYFRRYIYHKVNQKKTLREILASMELSELGQEMEAFVYAEDETEEKADKRVDKSTEEKADKRADKSVEKRADKSTDKKADKSAFRSVDKSAEKKEEKKPAGLHPEDFLTDKNMDIFKKFLQKNFDKVLKLYEEQFRAAGDFYEQQLQGCAKACAVDIGWAGSGAVSLSYLVEKAWKIPCEITGIIAGTNTVHNAEPDASEAFLQSGRLVSYLFSQSHNRDVMKKHDLNKDYNVYWELLLSSPEKHFQGFCYNDKGTAVEPLFGKEDENVEGIREIQRGIRDFADEYTAHFGEFPYMLDISGRDAYAPMLVAASHKEKYLKAIEKRFALDINV